MSKTGKTKSRRNREDTWKQIENKHSIWKDFTDNIIKKTPRVLLPQGTTIYHGSQTPTTRSKYGRTGMFFSPSETVARSYVGNYEGSLHKFRTHRPLNLVALDQNAYFDSAEPAYIARVLKKHPSYKYVDGYIQLRNQRNVMDPMNEIMLNTPQTGLTLLKPSTRQGFKMLGISER
jgi:hypothetical protein